MRDDEHKAKSAGRLAACPPVGTSSLTGRFRQIRCEWRRKSCRLKAIEDDSWTGGPEACRKYSDEQCLVAFSELAGVMSRDDIANQLREAAGRDVTLKRKGMAELSDTSAVLTYECKAKRKDGPPYHALVSSGYVRRTEGWKLAFHQQTQWSSFTPLRYRIEGRVRERNARRVLGLVAQPARFG